MGEIVRLKDEKPTDGLWVAEWNPHQRQFHVDAFDRSLITNLDAVTKSYRGLKKKDPKNPDEGCWVPFFLGSYEAVNNFMETFRKKNNLYQVEEGGEGACFCPNEEALLQYCIDGEWEGIEDLESVTGVTRQEIIGKWFLVIGSTDGTRVFVR